MKKGRIIGLIGVNNVKNIGDPILYKSAEYLIQQTKKEGDTIRNIDIHGNSSTLVGKLSSKMITALIFLLDFIGLKNSRIVNKFKFLRVKLLNGDYYKAMLNDIDLLIFAGGGLIKFYYEEYSIKIPLVMECAYRYNKEVNVYFNAVGVEGYSDDDIRCVTLKKWLNHPSVKVVTTRDDIATLENKYIQNSKILRLERS